MIVFLLIDFFFFVHITFIIYVTSEIFEVFESI